MIDIEFYMKVGELKKRLKVCKSFSKEGFGCLLKISCSPHPVA